MDIETLKSKIIELEPTDFVSQHIIAAPSKHLTIQQIEYIRHRISEAVGIEIEESEINVVGSAKLGFGLFEKKRKDRPTLEAFREFGPESDIDIAFSSPKLFEMLWKELCDYASAKPWMPYKMNNTGHYLVYGWLRPDQIPYEARLRTLDHFNDRLGQLSRSSILGRRKVSGALYRDISFLSKYQTRGISLCRKGLT